MLRLFTLLLLTSFCTSVRAQISQTGELKKWHNVTLTMDGPKAEEEDRMNPFLHYRLNVTFRHDSATYVVPGYFAADGNAAETSATGGNKWRVHFAPDQTGDWAYEVSFRAGANAAVSELPNYGEPVAPLDGIRGKLTITATDKTGRDLRAKGRLLFHGRKYPVWAETREVFLKAGADAPENLLSYRPFDGTFHNDGYGDKWIKDWAPHLKDWKTGDPTWQGGKGKEIIGAVNYLASKGMNAFSFLTLNIVGDDKNVFPYINYHDYQRMDVSKLAQWEILFKHASEKGMFLHFKMAEVENQSLLDNGDLGPQRKLYYRELMARFGHHLALNWNVCEENGKWNNGYPKDWQTTTQRLAMARYFYDTDPYRHHVVIHNGQGFYDLLGPESKYSGLSLQTNREDFGNVYPSIRRWHRLAKENKVKWAIAIDEPGDAQHSLVPDVDDPTHDDARQNALWGAFMAGAWGIEWYFGYKHAHSDLSCQDWRSRDAMWDQSRYALDFFRQANLPLAKMAPDNDLTPDDNDWVMAGAGKYVIFRKQGPKAPTTLKIADGAHKFHWYNPRKGEFVVHGNRVVTGGVMTITVPPWEVEKDWVLLVE
jgi:hypothetical protein